MSLRESLSDPYSTDAAYAGGAGDYQAVDDTAGFFMTLLSFCLQIWWVFLIMAGAAALSLPYLFPQWAQHYRGPLSQLSIAANSKKFVENTAKVDWSRAFSQENIKNLFLVGTGAHKQFKEDDALTKTEGEENYWYTGDVFMMKRFVTELEYRRYYENVHTVEGDMHFPATEVDFDDALGYCMSIGGRIPYLDEIGMAYALAGNKEWQSKAGDFIKPNLQFELSSGFSLWTATPESDGFFDGDNYAIFSHEANEHYFEDDGFDSESVGFLCVVEEKD